MRKLKCSQYRGFTLIELMITIVIVGVIAAIALPGYQSSVRKSKRTEAKTELLQVMARQEQYFSENRTYTAVPGDLGYTAAAGTPRQFLTENSYYVIWLDNPTSTVSVAVATATGTQVKDSIQKFRIWSNGRKEHSLESGSGGTFISGWDD